MLSDTLLEKLEGMRTRHAELQDLLGTPEVAANPGKVRAFSKEFGVLTKFVKAYEIFRTIRNRQLEAQDLLDTEETDADMRELAEMELEEAASTIDGAEQAIRELFATDDVDADRDCIIEIRAGAGGDEAALFVADLFRMYERYAEKRSWKFELMHCTPTELGGFKEIIFSVEGSEVYKLLRHESGGHRVQRVPATETSGRRHTSAVTVAVLPVAEEVDVDIKPDDLRWDIFRASGPGGQGVNKTSSAVRLTHNPTGVVVSMQDERSQHKNRAKAMRVLRSRLFDLKRDEEAKTRGDLRRDQVGSGDRSERIRTYNFPENRLNDHRIGLTLYSLEAIMFGDLDPVIKPMLEHQKQLRLSEL